MPTWVPTKKLSSYCQQGPTVQYITDTILSKGRSSTLYFPWNIAVVHKVFAPHDLMMYSIDSEVWMMLRWEKETRKWLRSSPKAENARLARELRSHKRIDGQYENAQIWENWLWNCWMRHTSFAISCAALFSIQIVRVPPRPSPLPAATKIYICCIVNCWLLLLMLMVMSIS